MVENIIIFIKVLIILSANKPIIKFRNYYDHTDLQWMEKLVIPSKTVQRTY